MDRTSSIESQLRDPLISTLFLSGTVLIILPAVMVRLGWRELAGLSAATGLLLLLAGIALLWVRHEQSARQASRILFARDSRPSRFGGRAILTTTQAARPPGRMEELRVFGRPHRPTHFDRALLDVIEWQRFEAVVELLFRQVGFSVSAGSVSLGTPGKDSRIWLYLPRTPDIPVAVVRCLHAPAKEVGLKEVKALHELMLEHDVARGHLVTSATFTRSAQSFANGHGITLVDGDTLVEQAAQRPPEQQRALLETALEGDFWRPSCTRCGTKLWPRVPRAPQLPYWTCGSPDGCRVSIPVQVATATAS